GGEEHVASALARVAQGHLDLVDVPLLRSGERAHRRTVDLARDRPHRFEVARRGGGATGLDHVDPQTLQRAGDADLLVDVHARAGGLLSVAQRGVEHDDAIVLHAATSSACVPGTGTFPSPPRSIAMAPVRTTSATPNGRSTSRSPSMRSWPPVISSTTVAGERSTMRARKASQMRSTSLRWWSGARTFTSAISWITEGELLTSSTRSTSTSLSRLARTRRAVSSSARTTSVMRETDGVSVVPTASDSML